jgi:hypothetical protein
MKIAMFTDSLFSRNATRGDALGLWRGASAIRIPPERMNITNKLCNVFIQACRLLSSLQSTPSPLRDMGY